MHSALCSRISAVVSVYHAALKGIVYALAAAADFSIMAMMLITCTDVVLRIFNHPIKGAYDLVLISIVITITCALPYTTAVKGHVAIEFLFQRLSRLGKILMDTAIRLVSMALFV